MVDGGGSFQGRGLTGGGEEDTPAANEFQGRGDFRGVGGGRRTAEGGRRWQGGRYGDDLSGGANCANGGSGAQCTKSANLGIIGSGAMNGQLLGEKEQGHYETGWR
ncbi:hypothetical protein Salat_1102800 [Sesamum alatum]|uniref:Uncharacterized protein n=1 Tax=Sesamum alatum TaxID=300844 RepID=A0AAE1YNC0_9LAMI|nr:hypothetical protein Salat_1102800 [Sesamum alatum]